MPRIADARGDVVELPGTVASIPARNMMIAESCFFVPGRSEFQDRDPVKLR